MTPQRWQSLPKFGDLPVPFFVSYVNGVPDFRCTDAAKVMRCARERLCGICGESLEYWIAFIGGPQTLANRYTSETPLHIECADAALKFCPYLNGEHEGRRREGLPADSRFPVGCVEYRPTQIYLIITRNFEWCHIRNDIGFRFAPPKRVETIVAGKAGVA